MISIGAHYGGPELKGGALNLAIQRIAGTLKALRADAEVRLNAVFYVPGSLNAALPFNGLRYGQFSRSPPCLVVQVALPDAMASDPVPLLLRELHGCNAMAFEYYRQKGLSYPLADAEALVNSAGNSLLASDLRG